MVDDRLAKSANWFLERLPDDRGCCHGTRPMFGGTRVHWGVYFTVSWSLILFWCYMLLQVPQTDSLFADPPMYTLYITASLSPETCALLFLRKSPHAILDQFVGFKEDGHAPEWTCWMLKYFHLLVTRAFGVVVTHRVWRFVMRRAAVQFPAWLIPFTKMPTWQTHAGICPSPFLLGIYTSLCSLYLPLPN